MVPPQPEYVWCTHWGLIVAIARQLCFLGSVRPSRDTLAAETQSLSFQILNSRADVVDWLLIWMEIFVKFASQGMLYVTFSSSNYDSSLWYTCILICILCKNRLSIFFEAVCVRSEGELLTTDECIHLATLDTTVLEINVTKCNETQLNFQFNITKTTENPTCLSFSRSVFTKVDRLEDCDRNIRQLKTCKVFNPQHSGDLCLFNCTCPESTDHTNVCSIYISQTISLANRNGNYIFCGMELL